MQTLVHLIADGLVIPVVLIGAILLIVKVPRQQRFAAYSRIIMAGLTTYLLAKLAGQLYQPELERPFQLLGVAPGALYLPNAGFPSDHALFATAITLAVWFETRIRWAALVLALCTVLICIGRVVALVHTPADVVFGVIIGLIGGMWYLQGREPIKRST